MTNHKVIPIYSKLKKSKFKLINYLKSFFIPFYFKSQLRHIDVIKQNQLNGSWISIILKYILKNHFLSELDMICTNLALRK